MKRPPSEQTEIVDCLRRFFRERADDYGIDMAFLYGSRATGLPRLDSDLDVAVLFDRNDMEEAFGHIVDISFALTAILKMEVNVLQIHDGFRKPMLYYNVVALGLPIYVRNNAHFLSLRNQAIFHMEDFGIFGLGWQHEVAKRSLESVADGRV